MPSTIKRRFRITGIQASPITGMTPETSKPDRIMVTAVETFEGAPPPSPTDPSVQSFQWPFDDPAAAQFFDVNEDVEMTFTKVAAA